MLDFELESLGIMLASQNHRMLGVGRDLCGSSSPPPLLKQGQLVWQQKDLMKHLGTLSVQILISRSILLSRIC